MDYKSMLNYKLYYHSLGLHLILFSKHRLSSKKDNVDFLLLSFHD